MNKEIKENIFTVLPDDYTQEQWCEMYVKVVEQYQKLQEENYKERIDKAIEYIEERKNLNWYADGVFVYELLKILGGDK